jgi:WD40 repeat protein/uncharacterized caspase-like protein
MNDHEPSRFLIAVGTERYTNLGDDWQLTSVPADLDTIENLFASPAYGYRRVLTDLRMDPTSRRLLRGLQRWLTDHERSAEDVAILYYTGHGDVLDPTFYLITADTEDGDYENTAVDVGRIIRLLRQGSPVRRLLVVIDACYSGQGAEEIAEAVRRSAKLLNFSARGEGVWVLAAARPRQEARESKFAQAFADSVRYWQGNTGAAQQYIALETIIDTIAERLGATQQPYSTSTSVGAAPFFPNPNFNPALPVGVDLDTRRKFSRFQQELAEHWSTKARGSDLVIQGGWYFTGRHRALQDAATFLASPSPATSLQVLTGDPGSGKSAVMGRLVLHGAHATSNSSFAGLDDITLPELRIDAPLLARGKTATDLRDELAEAIKLPSGADIFEEISTRSGSTVIVMDALDEAVNPHQIVGDLIAPLLDAGRDRLGRIRMLVGTRRNLLAALPTDRDLIDLDEDDYLDPADITRYIYKILTGAGDLDSSSPYQNDPKLADAVAVEITRVAGHSFLIAQLAARTLAAEPTPLTAQEVHASRSRWRSLDAAFERDLERYAHRARTVRDLLGALAWTEGAGLPRQLWPTVANAVASAGSVYHDRDIGWLLEHAGGYIIEALEDDRAVYRLYHQEFADHFRRERDAQETQSAISRALLTHVPRASSGRRNWSGAAPYLLTHLAAHAAAGRRLDTLLNDLDFLVCAAPDRLLLALASADTNTEERLVELAFRRVVHVLRDVPADNERAAYLLAAARQVGHERLARAIEATLSPAWRLRWTTVPADRSRVVGRLGSTPQTNLVALGTSADGRPIAIAASDREVRQWDLQTAEPAAPLTELNSSPTAVAATPDGRAVVVATFDRLIRVLSGGRPFGEPIMLPPTESSIYSTLTITHLGDRDVIVAVTVHSLYQWDFWSGEQLAGPIDLEGHPAASILIIGDEAEHDARLVLGRSRGELELRRLDDGSVVQDLGAVHTSGVKALAQVRNTDGQVGVVCASSNGELTRWQHASDGLAPWPWSDGAPRVGNPLWTLASDAGGRLLVTGGPDIRIWDALSSGSPRVLQGHEGPVRGLAIWSSHQRTLICSHGVDGTVRSWDAADAEYGVVEPDPMGAFSRGAIVDHDGDRILLCAKGDGRLERRDLASGALIDTPTVNGEWIYGLHPLPTRGRFVAGFKTGEVIVADADAGLDDSAIELSRVRAYNLEPAEELSDLVVTPGDDPAVITCCSSQGLRWWKLHGHDLIRASNRLMVDAISLAVHSDDAGDDLIFLDRDGNVWSLDLASLRNRIGELQDVDEDVDDFYEGRLDPEPTLLFETANANITSIAVSSRTSRIALGGTDRMLQIRDMKGSLLARVRLESWINDVVISDDAVTVLTNQGVLRLDGLLSP